MEVMGHRQPVQDYLRKHPGDTATVEKLQLVEKLLHFAHTELYLPDNGSYRSYSDIGRDFVLWNVFAAPELSLQPKQWCYLIVGCLGYRGYYTRQDAVNLATDLKDKGYDVYMGGVAAYSTLGWFSDPVLNTMLRWDDRYLARVIFHELAHQKLYVRDDTEFNEAFADAVATIAVSRWIEKTSSPESVIRYNEELARDERFHELVLDYRTRLDTIYQSGLPDSLKRTHKERLLNDLQRDYQRLRESWGDDDRYDRWMTGNLNNARLAAFATYRGLVPAFITLYEHGQRDLHTFYQRVQILSECDRDSRRRALTEPAHPPECARRD